MPVRCLAMMGYGEGTISLLRRRNTRASTTLLRRHENAAELDVSDELRFGLPSLPIRKRNGTPGRKPKGAGKGRRRTSRPWPSMAHNPHLLSHSLQHLERLLQFFFGVGGGH